MNWEVLVGVGVPLIGGLVLLTQKLTKIETKVDGLDNRLVKVETRLGDVEKQLSKERYRKKRKKH